jgi:hypothetical protein
MYEYYNIRQLELNALAAAQEPVIGLGISVYVNTNPDDIAPDFVIDPLDKKGIAIAREFFAKIAEHYKTLDNGQGNQAAV